MLVLVVRFVDCFFLGVMRGMLLFFVLIVVLMTVVSLFSSSPIIIVGALGGSIYGMCTMFFVQGLLVCLFEVY